MRERSWQPQQTVTTVCLAAPCGRSDGAGDLDSCAAATDTAQNVTTAAIGIDVMPALLSKGALFCASKLLGEIGHGLGVHLRRVPLQQHLEVCRAFAPGLAALPAVAPQIVAGGREHVWHAVNEIAVAVAVIVDG